MMTTSIAGNRRFSSLLLFVAALLFGLSGFGISFNELARVSAQSGPIIIEAVDEPVDANPSGPQTLRMVGPVNGPESLDPAFSRDLSTAFLVRQIFRGLTRLDRDLNPVPELADRIEISADGLTYQFHLRENATFQNGRPIDADDVVFSLTRAVDPVTAGGDITLLGGPTFLSDIAGFDDLVRGTTDVLAGVTAIDATTVEIRLGAPRSTFLMKLASAPGSIIDSDDLARGEEWWRSPNGTGPFRLTHWADEEIMHLEPFSEFFRGSPALTRVEFILGGDALNSFNLYRAGEIDIDSVTIDGIEQVYNDPELTSELTVTPLFNVDYISFRTDVEPLDDPHIRRALQLGFPRDKVAEVTHQGRTGKPEGLVPTGMLERDWPVEWPEYDLDAARAAIAVSRYGSADLVPPIEIYVSGYSGAEALRDSVREDLGLTVDVVDVEWSAFMNGLSSRSYPAYELYWGADYPDPESMLLSLFGSGRPDNYSAYSNPEFDRLLAQAASEHDVDARAALYAQAQQILIDDAVIMPLYYDVAFTLQQPSVRGLEITSLGILRLESVWLEN